jgi:exopolysaccharide production protein ExoZ
LSFGRTTIDSNASDSATFQTGEGAAAQRMRQMGEADSNSRKQGAAKRMRFQTLIACRGMIAVLVMLHHASLAVFPTQTSGGTTVLGGFFNFPYGRMAFFFAVSGFLLGYVHTRDFGQPARWLNFAVQRFRSIYPFYWTVLAANMFILTMFVVVGMPPHNWVTDHYPSPGVIASSFALVGPDAHDNVIVVAWTLFHEILFYAVVGLLIINRRLGIAAVFAWAFLVVAGAAGQAPDWVPAYVTNPLNLLFAYGFAAAQLVRRDMVPMPRLLVAGSGTAMVLMVWWQLEYSPGPVAMPQMFGAAWAVMFAGLATMEMRAPIKVPRVFLELGAASYALYLTHFTMLLIFAELAIREGLTDVVPIGIAFMIVVALTLASAVLLHKLIEQPLSNSLRRRLAPMRNRSGVAAE